VLPSVTPALPPGTPAPGGTGTRHPAPGNPAARPGRPRYFHCVETTKPPAMKPKPTTMFQLPSASTGRLPCVT
jgi:hypothetical protein